MCKEKYERLSLLWIILAVGSVLYYEHTLPGTLVRAVVIGTAVVAAVGAIVQYLYDQWLREKEHEENTPQ